MQSKTADSNKAYTVKIIQLENVIQITNFLQCSTPISNNYRKTSFEKDSDWLTLFEQDSDWLSETIIHHFFPGN